MVLWAWLNGYVDREQLTRELEEMHAKGLRGPILWDVASIRDPKKTIPAGPAFLGDESVELMHHALDEASRLGLEAGLFASCSWNAGGPWIGPELASKQLAWTELEVSGPADFSDVIPDQVDEAIGVDLRIGCDVGIVAYPLELVLEWLARYGVHDVRVHLNQAAVTIQGEAAIPGQFAECLDGLRGEPVVDLIFVV